MARPISEFPVKTRRSKYPWDKWLDGRPWEISETDVECSLGNFQNTVYWIAKTRGTTVRTSRINATTLVIQATGSS